MYFFFLKAIKCLTIVYKLYFQKEIAYQSHYINIFDVVSTMKCLYGLITLIIATLAEDKTVEFSMSPELLSELEYTSSAIVDPDIFVPSGLMAACVVSDTLKSINILDTSCQTFVVQGDLNICGDLTVDKHLSVATSLDVENSSLIEPQCILKPHEAGAVLKSGLNIGSASLLISGNLNVGKSIIVQQDTAFDLGSIIHSGMLYSEAYCSSTSTIEGGISVGGQLGLDNGAIVASWADISASTIAVDDVSQLLIGCGGIFITDTKTGGLMVTDGSIVNVTGTVVSTINNFFMSKSAAAEFVGSVDVSNGLELQDGSELTILSSLLTNQTIIRGSSDLLVSGVFTSLRQTQLELASTMTVGSELQAAAVRISDGSVVRATALAHIVNLILLEGHAYLEVVDGSLLSGGSIVASNTSSIFVSGTVFARGDIVLTSSSLSANNDVQTAGKIIAGMTSTLTATGSIATGLDIEASTDASRRRRRLLEDDAEEENENHSSTETNLVGDAQKKTNHANIRGGKQEDDIDSILLHFSNVGDDETDHAAEGGVRSLQAITASQLKGEDKTSTTTESPQSRLLRLQQQAQAMDAMSVSEASLEFFKTSSDEDLLNYANKYSGFSASGASSLNSDAFNVTDWTEKVLDNRGLVLSGGSQLSAGGNITCRDILAVYGRSQLNIGNAVGVFDGRILITGRSLVQVVSFMEIVGEAEARVDVMGESVLLCRGEIRASQLVVGEKSRVGAESNILMRAALRLYERGVIAAGGSITIAGNACYVRGASRLSATAITVEQGDVYADDFSLIKTKLSDIVAYGAIAAQDGARIESARDIVAVDSQIVAENGSVIRAVGAVIGTTAMSTSIAVIRTPCSTVVGLADGIIGAIHVQKHSITLDSLMKDSLSVSLGNDNNTVKAESISSSSSISSSGISGLGTFLSSLSGLTTLLATTDSSSTTSTSTKLALAVANPTTTTTKALMISFSETSSTTTSTTTEQCVTAACMLAGLNRLRGTN